METERKITIEIADFEAKAVRAYIDLRPGECTDMKLIERLLCRIVGTWEDMVREEEAPDAQDERNGFSPAYLGRD